MHEARQSVHTAGFAGRICRVFYIDDEKMRREAGVMPKSEAVGNVTEPFKVLNDPTLVKMACALSRAGLCVCYLTAPVGISH